MKNSLFGWNFDIQDKILTTASAESIWNIAWALEKDYHEPLWHRFIGLPGTIAGAVVGNAGCFGLETASNFLDATAYDMRTGEIKVFSKADMQFAYRHSYFKDHPEYFLVSARFDLSKKVEKYASDVDNIDFRENKQPKGNSCGSFFKNPTEFPEGYIQTSDERPPSAGALIEHIGFKGYRIGGAYWSPLHANFLLADTDCTPEDLITLVRMTQERVKAETGFDLVNEVRIIEEGRE